jgi:hypothetical protein
MLYIQMRDIYRRSRNMRLLGGMCASCPELIFNTGIFVAVCHYGIIEKICKRVSSGELQVFSLGLSDTILDIL